MRKKIFLSLGASAMIFMSCANEKLPKPYLLEGLRVLALPATASEIGAGETSTVTALVSDISGGGRIISYTAEQCLDPGVGRGAEPSCAGQTTRTSLGGGTIDLTTATPAGLGSGASVTFSAPAASEFVNYSTADFYNGISFLVVYHFTAGSDSTTAFRRIQITSRGAGERNSNPGSFTLTQDGTALTAYPTTAGKLKATLTSASDAETYTLKSAASTDQTLTEEISFSWLIAGGKLNSFRTQAGGENEFTPATTLPSPAVMVVVVRDNRGGVNFTIIP